MSNLKYSACVTPRRTAPAARVRCTASGKKLLGYPPPKRPVKRVTCPYCGAERVLVTKMGEYRAHYRP